MCTGLAFITDVFGKYGEGQINFEKSYVYLAAVTNFSQVCRRGCVFGYPRVSCGPTLGPLAAGPLWRDLVRLGSFGLFPFGCPSSYPCVPV
jgi:hypothetical protein